MSFKSLWCYPGYFALALLVLAYVGQVQNDTWRFFNTTNQVIIDRNIYIEPQPLSPETAKLVSFGANDFLADWYWLTLIQYYGGGDPSGKYRKLAELFNVVTELSPKFAAPYKTGLLILPGEGFTDEAIKLGEKGEKNLPDSWEIPYYTGLVHHIYRKDYAAAAKEFEKAAALPGAPANAKLFAAIYYTQADSRQTAYEIFKTIYETSDNDFARDRAKKYVDHLSIYFFLEDSVTTFKTRFGRYPNTLDELVSKHVITEIPVSPLNQVFIIDPKTGKISESKPGQ